MNAPRIVAHLARHGVRLYVAGDRLRYQGRPSAYTAERKALVDEERAAIVELLERRPVAAGPTTSPIEHLMAIVDASPELGLVGLYGARDGGLLLALARSPFVGPRYWDAWEEAEAARLARVVDEPPPADPGAASRARKAERDPGAVAARAEGRHHPHRPRGIRARQSATWPGDEALALLTDEARLGKLRPGFHLRPGVTVGDPAGFVAALRADAAEGPLGIRGRTGLLAADLADLAAAIDRGAPGGAVEDRPRGRAAPVPEGGSPDEHLATLGGYGGLDGRCDLAEAHALWDAARLWERDRETGRAARWATDYWRAWAAIARKEG